MSDVCFTLLGPPEVRHADQVLLFSTRKELSPHTPCYRVLGTASLFHRVILLSAEQDVNTSGFINVLLTLFLTLLG